MAYKVGDYVLLRNYKAPVWGNWDLLYGKACKIHEIVNEDVYVGHIKNKETRYWIETLPTTQHHFLIRKETIKKKLKPSEVAAWMI